MQIFKNMNPKIVEGIVVSVLVLIIGVLSIVFINEPSQLIVEDLNTPIEPNQYVIEDLNNPIEITPLDLSSLVTQHYSSPNGVLSFNAHWIQDKNVCLYDITDTDGKIIDVASLLGFETIYCSFESGKNSSFEKWVDENSFLISENYRTMYLVDLVSMSVKEYETGNPNYIFRDVNESFDYWVFQDGPTGPYVLLDSSAKVIKVIENSTYRSGDGVLYDKANQGFLFVSKVNNAEGLSIYLDFLPLDSKILERILKTKPVEVPARGCNSNGKLESVPGEIIFMPGDCNKVAEEYLTADGRIHILLNIEPIEVTNVPEVWKTYPSPTGAYTFEMMHSSGGWVCPYKILGSDGEEITTSFVSADTVLCGVGDGGPDFDGFEGWVDENTFIFSPNPAASNIIASSIMHLVDLKHQTEQIYEPPSGYLFSLYSPEHEYWLYRKGPEGQFVILDENKTVVKEVQGGFKMALYDTANDGFLFIGHEYNNEGTYATFDFLSLKTFQQENILNTKPVEVRGMGCDSYGSLLSVLGEIILDPGSCIIGRVKEYLGDDQLLHIPL